MRVAPLTLLTLLASATLVAQQPARYAVPRTEFGHPDFQGSWSTAFLTMLERLPNVTGLVATPEQAQQLVQTIRARTPALIDPDVTITDLKVLAMVRGEYRTSLIIDPKDGRMPFTPAGLELNASMRNRDLQKFDHPEERPLVERCLDTTGNPPIRTVPVFLPYQIVQTRDYVVLSSEIPGPRVIHL